MKILELVQGTPEWDAYRAKTFNASEAAAMLGYSRHQARNDLLKEKALAGTQEVGAFKQRLFDKGHDVENAARPKAEEIVGDELYPAIAEAHIDGLHLLASFDGITMDETVIWENKLWNEGLAHDICAGEVPKTHWPQLEHQLLVAGLDRAYFTISDEMANLLGLWYESVPSRRAQVLAGWKQFAEDLANYRHVDEAVAPEGSPIEGLPALFVEAEGRVLNSNLSAYREAAEKFIDGIKTDLQTDQDFADADKMVKFCDDAEKRLEITKNQVLAQTASIDELFRTIDSIREGLRKKRLELSKTISSRKDAIRAEIMQGGKDALSQHIDGLNKRLGKPYMPAITGDFAGVMKNKRTLSSLRDAVDTELAKKKIEANAIADTIDINLKYLRDSAADYHFLFSDAAQIVLKSSEDLENLAKQRISEHETRETLRRKEEEEAAAKAAEKTASVSEETPAPVAKALAPQTIHRHAEKAAAESETVTIPKAEYSRLLMDCDLLRCLNDAGVENWEGFDTAMAEFKKLYE